MNNTVVILIKRTCIMRFGSFHDGEQALLGGTADYKPN